MHILRYTTWTLIYVYIMKYSPQSSYLIYSSSHILTIFFFVVRRLKIYPLKNLKYTTQYSSLHIRALGHQSYITETLYPWVTFPHSPLLPAFGNHHSSLPFYEFVDVTYKWGHTIFVFVWLISLSVMSSRFIHAIANGRIFSFLKAEESIVWRYNPSLFFFLIHSVIHGHLGYFPVLGIVNNAEMNLRVQISLWEPDLISFDHKPRSMHT